MPKMKELPKEIQRRVDPETGFTFITYDNPEGARLKEKSDQRNARLRDVHQKAGMQALVGGGYKRSALPATHPQESHLQRSS